MSNRNDMPQILREFLIYHESIKNHSQATIDEYYKDLRIFFRFLKRERGLVEDNTDFDEISIKDIDIPFLSQVTLTEVYSYLEYLSRDRERHHLDPSSGYGLSAATRARKIASIRSFFKYLTVKTHQLEENPLAGLDSPKAPKQLPRYLTLDESISLLQAVDGRNKERDYCIICLFLNCGLRISEIVGLDIGDVRTDHLRVLGKGSKERIVYINDACRAAIDDYMVIRNGIDAEDKRALFLSTRKTRMSREAVHKMVKKYLLKAGLDPNMYSSHKLRHTAATLMLKNGVDVRTLQEVLGHDHLNTTQIYTHVDNEGLRIAAAANPLGKVKKKD